MILPIPRISMSDMRSTMGMEPLTATFIGEYGIHTTLTQPMLLAEKGGFDLNIDTSIFT